GEEKGKSEEEEKKEKEEEERGEKEMIKQEEISVMNYGRMDGRK
ncbi:hypothetical protein H8957_016609, partial [Semnopithecus entellus]